MELSKIQRESLAVRDVIRALPDMALRDISRIPRREGVQECHAPDSCAAFGWSVLYYLRRQEKSCCDRSGGGGEASCVWKSSRLRSTKCQNAASSFGKNAQYGAGVFLVRRATARSGASEDIGALLYGKEVPWDC